MTTHSDALQHLPTETAVQVRKYFSPPAFSLQAIISYGGGFMVKIYV